MIVPIHLPWLAKIWKTLHLIIGTLILFGLSIGIVTAFSLPNWAWTISNIAVRFLAVYVCIPTFGRVIGCRIRPDAYSGVCLLAVSGMCLFAGCLAISSFVCSLVSFVFFSIASFLCLFLGFFAFLLTEISLGQYTTKSVQYRGPLYQDEDAMQTITHANVHSPSLKPVASLQNVFICCDIEDEKLTQQVRDHLRLLEELELIDVWDQTKILPGTTTRDKIERAIEAAAVAIILISTNLLKSDYIMEYQLPTLLRYAEIRGTRVIPVEARACFYERTGLEYFQTVVVPGKRPKTLEEMSVPERNEYLSYLAEVIYQQLGMS